MSDTELQERQPGENEDRESGSREARGLGYFLRYEREKQGLDPEQIAEVTRLRRYIIEALETEAWDNLPQPVFVRGFIRAYAQALALDEDKAIRLYEESLGSETVEPGPLVVPPKGKAGRLVLLVLFLGFLGAAVYFYLVGPSMNRRSVTPGRGIQSEMKDTAKASAVKEVGEYTEKGAVLEGRPAVVASRINETQAPGPEAETQLDRDEALGDRPVPGGPLLAETPSPESEPEFRIDETETPVKIVEEHPVEQGGAGPSEILQVEENVLRATVIERTWVKIYLDDKDPREYIFRPGTRPQWKAKDGFNLVIGNATGIELEFNGKRIENLGNTGQVVRLSFPENFRSEKYED